MSCKDWKRLPMRQKRMSKMWHSGDGETKFGIYNGLRHEFQFGICEMTPQKAVDKLFKKIGRGAYKWRFEVCAIDPKSMVCVDGRRDQDVRLCSNQRRKT